MKMPARGLLRTTLFSSTAGMFLGMPLLGGLPTVFGGEPLTGPSVIRAQSSPDGGVISRWMGRRAVENAESTGSPEISDAMAAAPEQDPGIFSRLLGSSDPNSAQSQRQMSRAQQKMFRRNPQLMQMYMMQQQLLLLQQQRKLQQGYEEEGVPEKESFDSLSIDPNEWSDAPGRQITEQLQQSPASKPWWETGEKPVNARRRELELDDVPATPSAPAAPVAESIPTAPAAITDPFPAEAPPVAATPLPQTVPAPQSSALAVPINRPAPAIAAPDDFGLTFPSDSPAAPAAPAPAPAPAAPAATTTATAVPAAPAAPAPAPPTFAEPTSAPPFVEAAAPAMRTAEAPPAPSISPPAIGSLPPAPADFVPPAPIDAAPSGAPATVPAAPTGDADALPFPAPASPATEPIPPAPAAPVLAAEPSTPLDPFPAADAPLEDTFLPAAPAKADAFPPEMPATEFPQETAQSAPAEPAPFIPELPVEFGSPTTDAPAVTVEPAAPAIESPTAESDSPYSGLKLDDAPFLPAPATAEPETPVFMEPAVAPPAPATLESPTEPERPAETEDPNPTYQFAPQPAVATPNPASFIPPEPDDFGGTFANSPPQPARTLGQPRKIVADAELSLPQSNPDEFIAPDVTEWSPDPMQAPDPIVAPSTARQLVAAPPPSPRETQTKIDRIAARKGLSGFKGFCPVSLKDHRELIDARPEYSAVYNGRRYFFSSASAQALFEGNPDEYIPAAMGSDVVHLMLTGEQAAGSLEHAVWFRSKLYMFTTAETMETFVSAPSIHARDE